MTTLDELFGARAALIVPEAIGRDAAAAVRARLGFRRFALVDRGSYDVADTVDEPAVLAALVSLAAEITGRTLVVAEARALRLGPGDYALVHHDRPDDAAVELTLDLSAAAVDGAEVHYRRHGQVFFRVPSAPGALAVVERGPGVACHHTYVSKLHPAASIVRLMVRLHDRG